jgi:hypothetical protein
MGNLKFYAHKKNDVNSDDGPATAAVLTFSGKGDDSMVKELTQNSIDATQEDAFGNKKKLRITIKQQKIKKSSIPDFENFEKMLASMKKAWVKNSDSQYAKLFHKIENHLKKDKINMLVFEDFNTDGLQGDDSEKNTFKYCVNDENVSGKKAAHSLGGHGIGKNSVFGYSAMQTVFYSSLNLAGEYKFKGVSKLGTFTYNNEFKDNRIYYGDYNNGNLSLVSDINQIPQPFRRTEPGLSQFVLFTEDATNFVDNIKKSFLEKYWLKFEKDEIEVSINDEQLDNSNFYEECLRLYGDVIHTEATPLQYIKTYRSSKPVFKKIHKIGSLKLYLREAEDGDVFHNKILFLRDGMMIKTFNKGVGGLPKNICGVMYCEDNTGNAILGAMEPHAHDNFYPDLLDDKTVKDKKGNYPTISDGKKIIRQIEKFIKEEVEKVKQQYIADVSNIDFVDALFAGVLSSANGGGEGKDSPADKEKFHKIYLQKEQVFNLSFSSLEKNSVVYNNNTINVGQDDDGEGGGSGNKGKGGKKGKGLVPGTGTGGGATSVNSKRPKPIKARFFLKETGSTNKYSMVLRSQTDLKDLKIEIGQYSDSNSVNNLNGSLISAECGGIKYVISNNKVKDINLEKDIPKHFVIEIEEKFTSALALKN